MIRYGRNYRLPTNGVPVSPHNLPAAVFAEYYNWVQICWERPLLLLRSGGPHKLVSLLVARIENYVKISLTELFALLLNGHRSQTKEQPTIWTPYFSPLMKAFR